MIHAASEVFLELVFNEGAAFPRDSEIVLIVWMVGRHLITLVCCEVRSVVRRYFLDLDIISIRRWSLFTACILRGKEQ